MALTLSIDLNDADLADLTALLASTRRLGAGDDTQLSLEGTTLTITVDEPRVSPKRPPHGLDFPVGEPGEKDIEGEIAESWRRLRRGYPGAHPRNPGVDDLLEAGNEAVNGIVDFITGRSDRTRGSDRGHGFDRGRGPGRPRRHDFGSFTDPDDEAPTETD